MARYISEEEFIAWVREHWCSDCQNDNGLRCRACWIDDAIDIVEEAPTADVAPRAEVARQIFEEIKEQLRGIFDFFRQDNDIRESCAIMFAISEVGKIEKKYTDATDTNDGHKAGE